MVKSGIRHFGWLSGVLPLTIWVRCSQVWVWVREIIPKGYLSHALQGVPVVMYKVSRIPSTCVWSEGGGNVVCCHSEQNKKPPTCVGSKGGGGGGCHTEQDEKPPSLTFGVREGVVVHAIIVPIGF